MPVRRLFLLRNPTRRTRRRDHESPYDSDPGAARRRARSGAERLCPPSNPWTTWTSTAISAPGTRSGATRRSSSDSATGARPRPTAPCPTRPGEISVLNECRVGSLDGELDSVEGYARIVDDESNAKLKVYFSFFPGNYWIIDLDPTEGSAPYEWAVVGEGTRSFLWILSRTPQLDDETLDGILDRLEDQGYDLDRIRWTPQPSA